MKSIRALACVLLLFACGDEPLAVAQADSVRVEAGPGELIITNGRRAAIFYFAVTEGTLANIEWVPCTNAPSCPSIPAQTILRLPYSQVAGASHGGPILFHWWHAVSRGNSVGPDFVRVLRVDR